MALQKISTHILDTSKGKAAANVKVSLFYLRKEDEHEQWELQNEAQTDVDGRCAQLLTSSGSPKGTYKIVFDVGSYFEAQNTNSLYPSIEIITKCIDGDHYHIPLLLNPYGYSTYRGT